MGALAIFFSEISEPATLEALAVREALALEQDLYVHLILVASDCKVVQLVTGHSYTRSIEINRRASLPIRNIVHKYRSSNVEARTNETCFIFRG